MSRHFGENAEVIQRNVEETRFGLTWVDHGRAGRVQIELVNILLPVQNVCKIFSPVTVLPVPVATKLLYSLKKPTVLSLAT